MPNSQHFEKYNSMYDALTKIIEDANAKLIATNPDPFFVENANFHTKSFLVIMCAYLESYIKDILMEIVDHVNGKLLQAQLPYNLIRWGIDIDKGLNDKDMHFIDFKLSVP